MKIIILIFFSETWAWTHRPTSEVITDCFSFAKLLSEVYLDSGLCAAMHRFMMLDTGSPSAQQGGHGNSVVGGASYEWGMPPNSVAKINSHDPVGEEVLCGFRNSKLFMPVGGMHWS